MKIAVIRPSSPAGFSPPARNHRGPSDSTATTTPGGGACGPGPRELRRRPGRRRLTPPRRCMTTPAGSSSSQESSCDAVSAVPCGTAVISSTSLAAVTSTAHPGSRASQLRRAAGCLYWGELLEMWRAIYLRLAEELSCERYGPHMARTRPAARHIARDYRAGGYPMKPIGRPVPIKVPRRRPQKRRPKKAQPKPAKVPAGKP
ncbi:MAG: hypothetical protein KatS3mg038_0761 [Candidatus Kapaibacterium sp.]|nr:MAG: hypothetical protein KatS3mg038_0761 [Candidatus Kapabacteria bacterium]